ncbi:glycolate oxidase subunit GlcF [Rhizorhabdus argentea]|uniref:glycolate oxidase subunit GlcF n=1 Tax=Rhizorhabdus argentea TaxID=1387174 RepID=UPI0030EDAAB6
MSSSEGVIRKCVHCGFCTATCPTYILLGDELDSPRGRIYLMKEMLEKQAKPTVEVVKHIDRCLSCLSCMTTCPSGVNYMHLVDHARAYIEQNYRRSWHDRLMRGLLAAVLPYPARFRAALYLAKLGRPFAQIFSRIAPLRPLASMLALAPARIPRKERDARLRLVAPAHRVVLLQGCAEPVLRPEIRAATLRLLARVNSEVVRPHGEACCGALVHHLGREDAGLVAARRNIDAWTHEIETRGLDAIIITASGCGTTVKDYGHMLRSDPEYAGKAERVSALACDISEYLSRIGLPPGQASGLIVAYHAACSLQHGQKVTVQPSRLLAEAGFIVKTPAEGHLCCGSAGTYNILQPEISSQLGARKIANIERLSPDVIATGNVGCAIQIGQGTSIPVVHVVELLDWATGGPRPAALQRS